MVSSPLLAACPGSRNCDGTGLRQPTRRVPAAAALAAPICALVPARCDQIRQRNYTARPGFGERHICCWGVMAKQIRFAACAACIAAFLPVGAPTAQAKQCLAAPSNTHKPWTYRLIDGRKCWYEGKSVISRSLLHWPSHTPAVQPASSQAPASRPIPTTDEAPIKILTVKSIDLLDAQASVTNEPDDFESRWRARAILD